MTSILVVEDDEAIRNACRRGLDERGYAVATAATGLGGLELLINTGADVVLPRDGEYVLGRNEDATVRFDSLSVSRHHSRIRVSRDVVTIEDFPSRNGTFLNGERLTAPAPLADGDEITLGLITLRFNSSDPAARLSASSPRSHHPAF